MTKDICNICKTVVSITDLMKDATRSKGYRNKCKSCLRDQVRLAYLNKHGVAKPTKATGEYLAGIERRKAWLDSVRDVPCMDCGGRFPPCAMDFDHMRDKSFGIMGKYRAKTMEQLTLEIAKCEIVCSNCHRVRTEKRRVVLYLE